MDGEWIIIRKSPTADTRTSKKIVSKDELEKSSRMHIDDVRQAMGWLSDRLLEAGDRHDWTKISYLDEFYDQFHRAQLSGRWGDGWYDRIHVVRERHHLADRCPDDVDLIDVLEQIADSTMAGLARNGSYREEDLPDGLLERAYRNTIRKLVDATVVFDGEDDEPHQDNPPEQQDNQ